MVLGETPTNSAIWRVVKSLGSSFTFRMGVKFKEASLLLLMRSLASPGVFKSRSTVSGDLGVSSLLTPAFYWQGRESFAQYFSMGN